jgi:ketosteroid isomerase-like protein
MPGKNAEQVRRFYEAFNRRDLDVIIAITQPDCDWLPNPDDPEQGVRTGIRSLVAGMKELWETLERLHAEIEELTEIGDRILLCVHHTAVVKGSEAVIERREVHLWAIKGGKLARLMEFPDRETALEAATPSGKSGENH